MANEFELHQLQYAEPVKGEPKKLYLYDADGLHGGVIWFSSGPIKYPEVVVQVIVAQGAARLHMKTGLEVRVTDGGDMLLFHAKGGEILYPPDCNFDQFWGEF